MRPAQDSRRGQAASRTQGPSFLPSLLPPRCLHRSRLPPLSPGSGLTRRLQGCPGRADTTSQLETAGPRPRAQRGVHPSAGSPPRLLSKVPQRWVACQGPAFLLPSQRLLTSLHPHLKSGSFLRHDPTALPAAAEKPLALLVLKLPISSSVFYLSVLLIFKLVAIAI